MLNIVLVEPEIPQNTGSIGRLCVATGCALHLVEPLGFEISHSRLKRAGLDYWEHVNLTIHKSLEAFLDSVPPNAQKCFIEEKAGNTIFEHQFQDGAYLIFGRETSGLPDWIMNRFAQDTLRIPMFDARIRSLNLSNAVSITAYEAIRQIRFK
ncbi:MAG: tRNA (cytidine(34)-2'-O)-methyltransferase [Bdellovibrionales bacterium]|nr:tRNA (cytidine(34)-2'-O)-methyltransferase [Bdellovibrionales bacterium]